MPVRVELGHNQSFVVNGNPLEGVREVDVDVSTREVDITPLNASWGSALPLVADASLTVTLYYPDEMSQFWTNLNNHPKQAMNVAITGLFSGPFVVTGITLGCPMGGVVPHRVTMKPFLY